MRNATISVIIPAYRAERTIARAVESVLAQTIPAHEIIVINDGGDAALHPALAPYGRRVLLLTQPRGGAAHARNLGLDHASGDLIAFLDADDYWEPEKLATQLDMYRRCANLGLTCSRFYQQCPGEPRWSDAEDRTLLYDTVMMPSGTAAFHIATKVWTGTVMVPRRLLGSQRFVPGLEPAEDRHLWMRLISAAPVMYSAARLATAVLEPNSLSRSDTDQDCRNMLRVVEDFGAALGPREKRRWEAYVYRRWAAVRLDQDRPRDACRPALERWRRDLSNAEAWWIVAKSASQALFRRQKLTPEHAAKN